MLLRFVLVWILLAENTAGVWQKFDVTSNSQGRAVFSTAVGELLKQGRQLFKEETDSNENEEEEHENDGDPSDPPGMPGLGGGPGGNAAIVCPSGNKVYVHPISGDLQQCSQQLGFYNQTTCPGGTVCERFPILIPGFQDYCCWGNDTTDSEALVVGSGNTKGGVSVIDSLPGPDTDVDSSGGDVNGYGSVSSGKPKSSKKGGKETDNDEDEWIVTLPTTLAPKTKKTRRPRPRSRKVTTTAEPTTTTTTPAPRTASPRRGPRCRNSDDAPLIDFGNRLRDCYYQQCPYQYRCEFSSDIRRYICCGKERDVYPPPGLPPLPEPRPLVPRPFRPRGPQPYMLEASEGEGQSQSQSQEHESVIIQNCPAGQEHRGLLGVVTFCEASNLNLVCPLSHPYCIHSSTFGASVCCVNTQMWMMA